MAQAQHTPELLLLEEAIITLFCEIDDAYAHLNPKGQRATPPSSDSPTRK
jgi:hypothetical protein